MGIINDAMTALGEWFKGVLAGGIEGSLKTVNDMLSSSLNNSSGGGVNPLFGQFLGDPTNFTGSTGGAGTPIWNTIETLSNNVVVPIGAFVLMIVVIFELIQMVVSGNNFRDFDDSIFIKWILKTFCGILLVSNVFYIATGIFAFGTGAVTDGLNALFGGGSFIGNNVLNSSAFHSTLMSQDIGTLLITLVISFVMIIVTFVLLAAIIIVLANRIIELFMYLSISPIPMATFMNRDWSDIGKNWLRNILAIAFQGFFIVVALGVFKALFNNALTTMLTGQSSNIIMTMATLLGFVTAFIFTMFRTSSISKSAFAAH